MGHSAEFNIYEYLFHDAYRVEEVPKIVDNCEICELSGENHRNNGGFRFWTPQMFEFQQRLRRASRPPAFSPPMTL